MCDKCKKRKDKFQHNFIEVSSVESCELAYPLEMFSDADHRLPDLSILPCHKRLSKGLPAELNPYGINISLMKFRVFTKTLCGRT
jgi:hypothetical protein